MSDAVPTGLFGSSLRLADGDLVLAGGDLALISGRDNFAQSLRVIIETPFGTDQININYGLDVTAIFTVANSVRSIKDVIRLNIVKSLAADDRVAQIGDVVFDDDADFARLAPEFAGGDPAALARRGRAWHAVVTFTAVDGSRQRTVVSGASP
jgi:hypothetical protein